MICHVKVDRAGTRPIGLFWSGLVEIYLIDGTYELFRHYYALPSARDENGREVAAVAESWPRCWA